MGNFYSLEISLEVTFFKINVSFVLSNTNNSVVSSTFNIFHVEKIRVKRRINLEKPDSMAFELIIHNINNQEEKSYDIENGYPRK